MDEFKKWGHLKQVEPHWFWGNRLFFSRSSWDDYVDHYFALDGHKYGLFWFGNEAAIFLRDLDLIKKVQVTDFEHFYDFGFARPVDDIFGQPLNQFGLADIKGEKWRKLKQSVTPSFSVPRLKKNVPAMNDAANKLISFLHSQEEKEHVEALSFIKKYYLSCIASVGFGLNIDCFSDKPSEFEKQALQVFSIRNFVIAQVFPTISHYFNLSIIDKKFSKYLSKLCREVIRQREKQNLQYNDMLNNLIELSKINPDMTEEMMIKTCVQFFSDGYESASQVMGVLSYYLVAYPEIQEKLQDEVDDLFDSKNEGDELQAEDLNNMKYLDQVLNEGQRLACLAMTARTCTKDWKIPGESFIIPKNTRVIIPIGGLHFDPKYWPEPEKFDPDRFSSENKGKIESITFQTFGGGPRQCLGKNVYNVETKVLVCHLLRNFTLKPYGNYPRKMEWSPSVFIGKEKYDIVLERREH